MYSCSSALSSLSRCHPVAFVQSSFWVSLDGRRLFGSAPVCETVNKFEEEQCLRDRLSLITYWKSQNRNYDHLKHVEKFAPWHTDIQIYKYIRVMSKDSRTSHIVQTECSARKHYDMWINRVGRGMCWYSTDSSDFAYPWKAFCALWSNIWRADKNPSVASKQLRGLTLSKRGFYFPTVSTSCVYFIELFSSHSGAQQP